MKLVHTADWHIGKYVNEYSMLKDQEYFLDKFIDFLKEEKPDALLIAGDIYDRSNPPAEAVYLVDKTFTTIINDLKIPILAISGNHDSSIRIDYGQNMFLKLGLHIAGGFKGEIKKISLEDEHGKVNFYLLPYEEPVVVKEILGDTLIKNHEDAMASLLKTLENKLDKKERNVLLTHAYVSSSQANLAMEVIQSESERPLAIGGTEVISSDLFQDFDYVALGHLHAPQKVGTSKIRYAGSLLKYSLSEVNQKKSITVIELDKDGKVNVTLKAIAPLREMRIVQGILDNLLIKASHEEDNLEDYVFVELQDEGEVLDGVSKLRTVFPNIMGLKRLNSLTINEDIRTQAREGFRGKNITELFTEFYSSLTGRDISQEKLAIIDEIRAECLREEAHETN